MIRNIDAKFKKPYNNCNLRKIIYHQYLPMFMSIFNLRGAQTDRFRYEVFQNLFFSPMNTGFLRDTVATVLTVYGIETIDNQFTFIEFSCSCNSTYRLRYWNCLWCRWIPFFDIVATVLTVYGIETLQNQLYVQHCYNKLQQYLPFTVLKRRSSNTWWPYDIELQQYLPFTVLKQN